MIMDKKRLIPRSELKQFIKENNLKTTEDAYAGQRERVDRAGWCTATGEMVHGGRGRGAHDRHARLFYSVMPLSLRIESPSILIV